MTGPFTSLKTLLVVSLGVGVLPTLGHNADVAGEVSPGKVDTIPIHLPQYVEALCANMTQPPVPQIRITAGVHGYPRFLPYMGIESHGERVEAFAEAGLLQR